MKNPVLKKVEIFFDLENFLPRLALSHRNAMRHPRSNPFPCDPNRESPPSLITSKREFLPLGSHCDTGTQIGLKVGKNFFRLKLSQSPETWKNTF